MKAFMFTFIRVFDKISQKFYTIRGFLAFKNIFLFSEIPLLTKQVIERY